MATDPSPQTKRRKLTTSTTTSDAASISASAANPSPNGSDYGLRGRKNGKATITIPDRATQTRLKPHLNGTGGASQRVSPAKTKKRSAALSAELSTNGGTSSEDGARKKHKQKQKQVVMSSSIPPDAVRRKPPALTPAEVKDLAEKAKQQQQEELRQALVAQVQALSMENEDLQAEIEREERRVERERVRVEALQKEESSAPPVQAMIERLLAANDASFKKLPERPTFDFDKATADEETPSTLPLPVEDPLPQLTMFSNLTFTSRETTVLPAEDGGGQTRQKHEIGGYAGDKYLSFRVRMQVDLSSLVVEWVHWDISPWAKRELTSFLTQAATDCNISSVLYAISSYTMLNTLRAKTFARLCHAFPNLLPTFTPRANDKGKGRADEAHKPVRREIVPHFGESILRFRDRAASTAKSNSRGSGPTDRDPSDIEFVVEWKVQLDDVGEAESVVRGDMRAPVPWVEVDEERSLKKVGTTFEMLVGEKGVFEAVRCMIGLLFPEHSA